MGTVLCIQLLKGGYILLLHTFATTWRFNFSISSHFDRSFLVAPTVHQPEYHMICHMTSHMISLQSCKIKTDKQTNNVKDVEQRKRQYDRRRILYLDTASSGWERQHCQSSLSNALFAPTFGFGFDAWIETGLFASSGSAHHQYNNTNSC